MKALSATFYNRATSLFTEARRIIRKDQDKVIRGHLANVFDPTHGEHWTIILRTTA